MPKAADIFANDGSETTLGGLLLQAREKRELPIEKAAHDTRIRVQRLREIENDDFSQFTHPSYARMFLLDYAKYLQIPISDIRPLLPDPGECGVEGYQYLQDNTGETAQRAKRPVPQKKRLMPALVGAAVLLVCLAGGVWLMIVASKLTRLGTGEISMTQPVEATVSVEDLGELTPVQAAVEVEDFSDDKDLLMQEESATPASPESASSPSTESDSTLFVGGTREHSTGSFQ